MALIHIYVGHVPAGSVDQDQDLLANQSITGGHADPLVIGRLTQVQERTTKQVADWLSEQLRPKTSAWSSRPGTRA